MAYVLTNDSDDRAVNCRIQDSNVVFWKGQDVIGTASTNNKL